ncbi:hypothetical protein QM007_10980 [Rothia sp. SD9660Na]|uniref:hypothetical protein n=1 Tax=Rothia sp. SD9660Na TaxID=3047030 RepID=UPI0024B99298|nr:hypothetical protein [Rothia sp. SD9660Na]WHS50420.1 hypothetical protein QM007_10980 [Rothia sp. SD9660Na]
MNFFYELISWFGVFIIYGLLFFAFAFIVYRIVIKEKPRVDNSKNKPTAYEGGISSGGKSVLGDGLAQPMELYGSSFAPGRSARFEASQKSGRESSSIYNPGKDPLES